MKRLIDGLILVLIAYVGLHLPRSFMLLYGFAGLVLLRSSPSCPDLRSLRQRLTWRHVWQLAMLLLFSLSYCIGMLHWRFWSWPADALDLLNALILPALLMLAGLRAGFMPNRWSDRLFLVYAIGGLAYLLIALILAREPWWNWSQIFPASIPIPWGSHAQINVRSLEQNGYPALLLLVPGLQLLFGSTVVSGRLLAMVFLFLSACGAHVVGALNGRLGWLALVLAGAPVLGLSIGRCVGVLSQLFRVSRRVFVIGASSCVVALALGFNLYFSSHGQGTGIWAQGLCDERIDLFGSILTHMHQAPWGGRLLQVPFRSCGAQTPMLFSANGGALDMAHNVFLDIYFNVGLVPALLLLGVVVPSVVVVARGFLLAWPRWDWRISLRWGWACLLLCQWLFQPLLYSDGLLYYISFFILGLFVVQGLRAFAEGGYRSQGS